MISEHAHYNDHLLGTHLHDPHAHTHRYLPILNSFKRSVYGIPLRVYYYFKIHYFLCISNFNNFFCSSDIEKNKNDI